VGRIGPRFKLSGRIFPIRIKYVGLVHMDSHADCRGFPSSAPPMP
jgi:hypothetical protein